MSRWASACPSDNYIDRLPPLFHAPTRLPQTHFPPLKPVFLLLLGFVLFMRRGWMVEISKTETCSYLTMGCVCWVLGVILTVCGVAGLMDWSLRL
jgi:hypothetical protein